MAQVFRPGLVFVLKVGTIAVLLVCVAGILSCRSLVVEYPSVNAAVAQVPPFSHKHHVSDVGLDCRFCHASVETSAFAGIPPTSTCMNCHSQLFKDQAMLAPVFASFRENRPLHWVRVHRVPDFVYFNHGIHVAKGVGCSTCHGQVDQMPLMWRTQSLEMEWCLGCHRAPEQYLRPRDKVFDMTWRAPRDQLERGRALLVAYQIDRRRLTDCSNCHR
jgi:Cytochrome c7 and related cytochrome c